jgi:CheY-like chemotaxis protein
MASILLVEDHADMQIMLGDLLQWGGHQVLFGRTGEEGLDTLKHANHPPDIIISDLYMPAMDGLKFLNAVRQNPDWSNIRFVIMSANPHDERLASHEANGLNGVLPKPFTLEDINHILTA